MGIFSNFTGGRSRRDAAAGHTAFRREVTAGRERARPHLERGRDRFSEFERYGREGLEGNRLYGRAVGAYGAEPRQEAFELFESDPFRGFANQNTENALMRTFRRYNAGGLGDSAVNRAAVGEVAGRFARQDVNDFLNRLRASGMDAANIGLRGASGAGGFDRTLADLETNAANVLGHSHLANALYDAGTRSTGLNNLLRLGGTAARIGSLFV
ncbi:MAG: hypothetical protein GDA50_04230 [Alphaproteobacteria bacterium GM202ARS2]|nr:hypothetical protein [Alphaproteobacteria bacterium GM202ARS2]